MKYIKFITKYIILLCLSNIYTCSLAYASVDDLNRNSLIIILELQNLSIEKPDKHWADIIKNDDTTVPSISSYWERVSYDQAHVTPAKETYGVNDDGVIRVKVPARFTSIQSTDREIYKEALKIADQYIDFSLYDLNHDTLIDPRELGITFIIPYNWGGSVKGAAITDSFDGINFAQLSGELTEVFLGQKRISFIRIGGVNTNIDTHIHETGHLFYKLRDLYHTRPVSLQVSGLMSGHNNRHYLSTYSAYKLGFRISEQLSADTLDIVDSAAPKNILGPRVYRISTKDPDEYFLLQNIEGTLNVTHITSMYDLLAYRQFPDKNGSYRLSYASNKIDSVFLGTTISNVKSKTAHTLQFDVIKTMPDENKSADLIRPILRDKGMSNGNTHLRATNWGHASFSYIKWNWTNVNAEKYGLKITLLKENETVTVYENMNLTTTFVSGHDLIPQEKMTIEVTLYTYSNNSWSEKTYLFFHNYDEALEPPTYVITRSIENNETRINWIDNEDNEKGYLIFADGLLLDRVNKNTNSYVIKNIPFKHIGIRAYDHSGNVSTLASAFHIKNHENTETGLNPASESILLSKNITFEWNDYDEREGAYDYPGAGKYFIRATDGGLVEYGRCVTSNTFCFFDSLPSDSKGFTIDLHSQIRENNTNIHGIKHVYHYMVMGQKKILETLYNNTKGNQWYRSDNWLIGDPCSNHWYGITCTNEGYINNIDLHANNLSGHIPSYISYLSNLKYLHLHDNDLTDIPTEIYDMDNLIISPENNNGTMPIGALIPIINMLLLN